MDRNIGVGLLGLGTVGSGVASIFQTPKGRNPQFQKSKYKK